MTRAGDVPPVRVFVDSPMASEVTRITARHFELFDDEARRTVGESADPGTVCESATRRNVEESKALNRLSSGAIIMAASGMCDGGRIRHHLRQRLPDPRTTVLFIGYQAAGTLGRRLVDGVPVVRMFGVEFRCARRSRDWTASPPRRPDSILAWLHGSSRPGPGLLVHGEPGASAALAEQINGCAGRQCCVPAHGQTVTL